MRKESIWRPFNHCPSCGSGEAAMKIGEIVSTDGSLWEKWGCRNCDTRWMFRKPSGTSEVTPGTNRGVTELEKGNNRE